VTPGQSIVVGAGLNLGNIEIDGTEFKGLNQSDAQLARSANKYVTIRSASATNPAVFQQLLVSNVNYLRFSQVKFNVPASGKTPFYFQDSSNLELSNSIIQGQRVSGLGAGHGPHFAKVRNFTVSDNQFLDLYASLSLGSSQNAVIARNQILRGAFDSIHFGSSVTGALVEENVINAAPSNLVKHVDLIQVINMTSGVPSSNLTFRKNRITASTGVGIHGIYLGNYDAQNRGNPSQESYSNIVIEQNYIESTQMAAITVSYAKNVTIRNNTAIRPPGSGKATKLIANPTILIEVDNTGVTITGNTTSVPIRAGHLLDQWRSLAIPSAWTVNNNSPR
jgi:hypothetical protein